MIVLGIETATLTGGVALLEDGRLVGELRMNVKVTHSERLLPGLDHLLKTAGLAIGDVDVIAFSAGPGSFTGLRVGLSLVKGLAFAAGKPVTAVPTLEALAWNLPFSPVPVCTFFDARKKELYGAVFEWKEGGFRRLVPEGVKSPSEWARDLSVFKQVLLTGEGALLYKDEFLGHLGENALFAPAPMLYPSPVNVALIGYKMALEGAFSDPAGLGPFYIRRSEAELKLKGKQA